MSVRSLSTVSTGPSIAQVSAYPLGDASIVVGPHCYGSGAATRSATDPAQCGDVNPRWANLATTYPVVVDEVGTESNPGLTGPVTWNAGFLDWCADWVRTRSGSGVISFVDHWSDDNSMTDAFRTFNDWGTTMRTHFWSQSFGPTWNLRAAGNVTHVQNALGDSQVITIPATVAGDALILTIEATGLLNVPQVQTITDNGATHATYVRALEDAYVFPSIDAGVWYASNIPAGITQVTVNWSAGSVSNGWLSVWVGEYAGLAATGMLDRTAYQEHANVTSHPTGSTAVITAANELVVALYADSGNSYTVGTPGSPWNLRLRADANGFDQLVAIDRNGPILDSYSATFTSPAPGYSISAIATFKQA